MVTGSTGMSVPVYQIADFESDNSPVTISKMNQKVIQNVEVTLKDGVDPNTASEEIYDVVDHYDFRMELTTGKRYAAGDDGCSEIFSSALIVAFCLVYIVLAAQVESFILPVMVMMSILSPCREHFCHCSWRG